MKTISSRTGLYARPGIVAFLFFSMMLISPMLFAQNVKITVTPPGAEGQVGDGSQMACGQVCANCAHNRSCTKTVPKGSQVNLNIYLNAGHTVKNWTGACAGQTSTNCSFKADGDKTVGIEFNSKATFKLTAKPASGGNLASGGFNCSNGCSTPVNANTQFSVSAEPNVGYVFAKWGDACAGQTSTPCKLNMTADATVSATFTSVGAVKLTVNPPGPEGQIGDGSQMACGQVCANCAHNRSCSKTVTKGSQVNLNVYLNKGYSVKNWTGVCAGKTGTTCSYKADADQTVGIEFKK